TVGRHASRGHDRALQLVHGGLDLFRVEAAQDGPELGFFRHVHSLDSAWSLGEGEGLNADTAFSRCVREVQCWYKSPADRSAAHAAVAQVGRLRRTWPGVDGGESRRRFRLDVLELRVRTRVRTGRHGGSRLVRGLA